MQVNRVILFFIALSLLAAAEALAQDRIDFFEKKIRPVLAERCYQCHSAEAARKFRWPDPERPASSRSRRVRR